MVLSVQTLLLFFSKESILLWLWIVCAATLFQKTAQKVIQLASGLPFETRQHYGKSLSYFPFH